MPVFASMLWDVISTAGGTLALTFIVALAVGINALTLLFLGSAVVALERFARAVRGWRSVVTVGVVGSALVTAGTLQWVVPRVAGMSDDPGPGLWAGAAAASALLVAAAIGLTWLTNESAVVAEVMTLAVFAFFLVAALYATAEAVRAVRGP